MATALTISEGLLQQTQGFATESDVQTAVASATAGMATQSWAQGQFAPLGGNANQAFNVAPGSGTQAAQYQQVTSALSAALTNYLALTGGTLSGSLIIDSAAPTPTLTLSNQNPANGVDIQLIGNGSVTPIKTIRVTNGIFQILDSAYTAPVFQVDDAGNVNYVNTIAVTSTIYLLDENGGNVAFYVNPGTYDFVIGSGNPSHRFSLVFSGETGVLTLGHIALNEMDALPLGQAQTLFQPIKTQYKVDNLPTGVASGTEAQVTDALNPSWNQTLVGGGSTVCNALFNGTSWVAT